ncbi:MAG: proline--tRNA ligase [Armatimonadota bacterium]|nr:MAG: proline--tRNA ligase [Armatimonadota bacterium]
MHTSQFSFATLREAPADAFYVHERLLRRAGFVRKVEAGTYVLLPPAARAFRKMRQLLERECEDAGFHPLVVPLVEPDQAVLESARPQVRSWRALPLRWYVWNQIHREDVEPRGGLLETREFFRLQLWGFDDDAPSAMGNTIRIKDTLTRICRRMGLAVLAGECDGWSILVVAEGGEDVLLQCSSCGASAAPEWCPLPASEEAAMSYDAVPPAEIVSTPDLRTVEEVARFLHVPPSRLVKTLLLEVGGKAMAVLVRGDHELSLPKVRRALSAGEVRMMSAERVEAVSRAPVGFAGPVGLESVPLMADWAVRQMQDFVVGANLADAHRVHVCWGRDFEEPVWADLRMASPGDRCAHCGGELVLQQGILVGRVRMWHGEHGLVYDDAQGMQRPVQVTVGETNLMRTLAALVEASHDSDGIVWHPCVAPFEALVLLLNPSEEAHRQVAEKVYQSLQERGIDVLLDDRDERAGAKFKDADLIGIPVQVVVGRSASEGRVEVRQRRDRQPHPVAVEDVPIVVEELLYREKEITA